MVPADVLAPRHPRHGRRPERERPGRHARILRVVVATLLSEQASSALVDAAHGPKPLDPVASSEVHLARRAVADRAPGEAAVGRRGRDDPRGEDLLVAAQAEAGGVLLVPDRPGHGVGWPGERDVGLDAVAGRVDVQRRIAVAEAPPCSASRSMPVCCQQKTPTLAAEDGLKPVHGCLALACLTPLETKI